MLLRLELHLYELFVAYDFCVAHDFLSACNFSVAYISFLRMINYIFAEHLLFAVYFQTMNMDCAWPSWKHGFLLFGVYAGVILCCFMMFDLCGQKMHKSVATAMNKSMFHEPVQTCPDLSRRSKTPLSGYGERSPPCSARGQGEFQTGAQRAFSIRMERE